MKVKNLMFFGVAAAILSIANARAEDHYTMVGDGDPTSTYAGKTTVTSKSYVDLRNDQLKLDINGKQAIIGNGYDGKLATFDGNGQVMATNVSLQNSVDSLTDTDSAVPTSAAVVAYVSTATATGNFIASSVDSTDSAHAPSGEAVYNYSTAANSRFTAGSTGLNANNVQSAIEELDGRVNSAETNITNLQNTVNALDNNYADIDLSNISNSGTAVIAGVVDTTAASAQYDNTTSQMTASTIQSAIDELDSRVDGIASSALTSSSIVTGDAGQHSIKVNGTNVTVSEWPVETGTTCGSEHPCALVDDGTGTGGKIWRAMAI